MKYSLSIAFLFYILVLNAQTFYDVNTIQEIKITFTQSNWDALLDAEKASTENYIMAESVEINGEVFDSVGVKYKGNSTYSSNQAKNPFHIELDTYKDQNYDGYTDIKLSNGGKDPSLIREVLSYSILRNYMDAPLSNYANVYVNGNLIGLYSNSESISKKFVNDRFGSKSNALFKCNPPAGAGPGTTNLPNLVYISQDSLDYYDAYEKKSDKGWNELINLCDTLNNHIAEIEAILDVDRALWMLAFDNALVNLDSYIGGFAQNYYLYRDNNGRFIPIIWDLNESFGTFSMTGSGNLNSNTAKQQLDYLLNDNDNDYPLVKQLLNIPMYKRMYIAHFKTILEEQFDNGDYYSFGQTLQTLIDAAFQADPNKLFTYQNFLDNLDSDVSGGGGGPGGGATIGIKNLMDTRNSYILGLSDFTATQPTISNISLSDSSAIVGDSLYILCEVMNQNSVYLSYRFDNEQKFERIEMFDDGNHSDGKAGDGVFGAKINIENSQTQFYIYAENSNAGIFSPQRAEHEFHEFSSNRTSITLGDVVINEFLASNASVQSDQDGEFDDWIELYNNSSNEIDLTGYSLSDNYETPSKFTFPAGTTIEAGKYLIVWADNDNTQSGFHATFKLSSGGEAIYLYDDSGVIIDEVNFLSQHTDISYGRFPNGIGDFRLLNPTFKAENQTNISVNNIRKESTFSIYPNPAFNEVILQSVELPIDIQIYSVEGRLVNSIIGLNRNTIDVSKLNKGIYFLRVNNSIKRFVVK